MRDPKRYGDYTYAHCIWKSAFVVHGRHSPNGDQGKISNALNQMTYSWYKIEPCAEFILICSEIMQLAWCYRCRWTMICAYTVHDDNAAIGQWKLLRTCTFHSNTHTYTHTHTLKQLFIAIMLTNNMSGAYLEISCFDDSNISWNSVAKFNFNNIAQYQIFGAQRKFLALPDDSGELWHHVLERLHNLWTFRFLRTHATKTRN